MALAVGSVLLSTLLALGIGQGARLNVLYVPPSQPPSPTDVPPSPCVVDVQFLDAESNQVASQEFDLQPGQSGTMTLSRSALAAASHNLFYAQGDVQNTCDPTDTNCDPTQCSIEASVEVVDLLTGVTTVLVSSPVRAVVAPALPQ
jgi:hypothetical protein